MGMDANGYRTSGLIASGIGAVAAAAVLVVALATAAGGAPSGAGRGGLPVQTTDTRPPGERTATVTIDTDALLAQMATLPDPFPVTDPADRCVELAPGPATFPLFDGGSVTIAGTSAVLCEESSWWTFSWRGENRRADGGVDSSGSAVIILEGDGSPRSGFLANVDIGDAWYRYTPDDDTPRDDQYELVGAGFPPPLVVGQTAPPATTAPAATPSSGAVPAQPVTGSAGYAG